MGASASRRHYTLADYLGVEEMSNVRHELLDGQIFAIAGGTPEHAALSAAALVLLGGKLRGGPCRPYSADLRIRVLATGLATYPDAAVICGEVERDPSSPTHVTNPRVIVEVLSPSTEAYDRGEKREHYQQIEALREYVLIAQDRRRVEVFVRRDEGAWEHRVHASGDAVELPSLGLTFAVDELFDAAGARSALSDAIPFG
jgi:Uma2 family endonuclease